MAEFTPIQIVSAALYALTALSLVYASLSDTTRVKRWAALASILTFAGAADLMLRAYAKEPELQFERAGPIVRRSLGPKERGQFEYVDADPSSQAAAGDGKGNAGAKGTANATGAADPRASGAGQTGAAGSANPDQGKGGKAGTTASAKGKADDTASGAATLSGLPQRFAELITGSIANDASRARPAPRNVDCPDCPEMVVIEPGYFRMGAVKTDTDARQQERPRRTIAVAKRFAIGKFEVTIGEYMAFAAATGRGVPACNGRAIDVGNPGLPVTCVNWREARGYAFWLRDKTLKPYRLPSEAEWEFAARAGSEDRYTTGDTLAAGSANIGNPQGRLAEVGSFAANPSGLHDMHGNVAELTADCWQMTPASLRGDASSSVRGDCRIRALRDAAWMEPVTAGRLSARRGFDLDTRHPGVGFRVARDM